MIRRNAIRRYRSRYRPGRSRLRTPSRGRLRLEPLEARNLLALVTPVDDFLVVHQNSQPDALDVLANDQFEEAYTGERRITSVSYGSEGGSISIGPDGQSILYAPPADYEGHETFIYVIDGQFAADVSVVVQAPLAADEYVIPPDGAERTLDVLANDPFWDGYSGPGAITSVSVGSEGGTVVIAEDGKSVLYTPPDEAFGSETFVYIVDGIYPGRVTIEVPKTLEEDEFEIVQNTAGEFDVLANDPFWPNYAGERRITHVFVNDMQGTAEIADDGRTILYTPPEDFAGWVNLRYVVDGRYETHVGVRIHRPVQDDYFELDHNSTDQPLRVTDNDYYWDRHQRTHDVIDRVTAVTEPESGGTVFISDDGQSIIYTPPEGFSGTDTFTYTADGLHEAQVTVNVTRPVRDDHIWSGVYQDTPDARLDVLANDFLGNGYTGPRRITAVGQTENGGVVAISGDGRSLTYTPAPGYVGEDRFTYTVDGELDAEVRLHVEALAQNDTWSFCADPTLVPYTIDVLNNDHFHRGYPGPGEITSVTEPASGGSISLTEDGRILFTPGPTGGDQFTYTVDGEYEASVSVGLIGQLQTDSLVVDQNTPSGPISVLLNDFHITHRDRCNSSEYRGARRITGVSETEHGGTVTFSDDGRLIHYEPPADYVGHDSFTYTVDGIMQATVHVNVIRRVRDDEFRVDSGEGGQALPVLVNDLFGADYRGAQQITHVTVTQAGGTVAVTDDGRSIHYTPPAGFVGTDTFTYTVDGKLKAEARVIVEQSVAERFPTFGTLEEFEQFLIDDALERYEHLFGQPAWGGCWVCDFGPAAFDGAIPGSENRSHSETNVQVAGIDEADLMEFDSDYVYVLTGQDLVIADAWPAEEISIASRVDIEGRPIGQYLRGDRLTVISEVGGGYYHPQYFADFVVSGGIRPWGPHPARPFTTIVTIIDVSDRTAPEIVQTTSLEGRYVQSRGIGEYVYVLAQSDNAIAPPPLIIKPEDDCSGEDPIPVWHGGGTYETRDEYLARMTANLGDLVDAALPNYSSYGPDGELVRTGLLTEPEEILRPLLPDVTNLINVVSFHVPGDEPGLADTSSVYTSGAGTVYASLDNFYVFDRAYTSEDGSTTRIMKFDWEPETGGVEFAATGSVPGRMLNQFSADEHEGYLRIATTISNYGSGNFSGRDENTLFILGDDDGVLENIGSIKNLALDETLRSVRFMGERAFIVTFRNIDPLFGLDLSDPADPRAVGHLTLPGFSSYMQMIDDTHLLTVGKNTPNGRSGPTQVSLFDVSDLTQPRQIDQFTFERFSTSEAELDHHAFGYYAEHGLLAVPTRRGYYERVDEDGDGYRETRQWVEENGLAVLAIDAALEDGIQWLAEIPHDTLVRRSGYIGDKLYSIAEGSIKVVDIADPQAVVGDLAIEDWYEELPPLDSDIVHMIGDVSSDSSGAVLPRFPAVQPESPLASAVERARADLAGRLGVEAGAPLVVSAERTGSSSGEAFNIVLQVGEDHWWYRTGDDDSDPVRLVSSELAFAEPAEELDVWHAIPRPTFATQPTSQIAAALSGLSFLAR